MRDLERFLLLEIIDQRWREHLYDLDYLQQGIHLRAAAQIEPLVAYKNEAFELFRDLMNNIWGDFARMIFHVEVVVEGQNGGGAPSPVPQRPSSRSSSSTGGGSVTYSGGGPVQPSALAMAAAAGGLQAAAEGMDEGLLLPPVEQRRVDQSHQVGRNDPCWCGSGKKFKKCHGA
jgi:preprotein translocase subunit SecA